MRSFAGGGEAVDVDPTLIFEFLHTLVQWIFLPTQGLRHDQLLHQQRAGVMGVMAGALGAQVQQVLLVVNPRLYVTQTIVRVVQQHAVQFAFSCT